MKKSVYILIVFLAITTTTMGQQKNETSAVSFKTVQINDQTIFYREAGQANKQTLLFLHGFPSSSRMW
jgi:hypothetical protein